MPEPTPEADHVAPPLRVLSLCSGIGGLERGVRRVFRTRVVGYVERDAYAAACLLARMEEAELDPAPVWVGDIADLDARPLDGHVDVVCAGIPCQPWSLAGKRKGADDGRHLGHELARIVGEVGPRVVFVENVPAFAAWDGLGGLLGALSELGFDAEWGVLPAASVGACHRRRRLWVLAHADGVALRAKQGGAEPGRAGVPEPRDAGPARPDPDANGCGLAGRRLGGLLDRERAARRGDAVGSDPAGDADAARIGRTQGGPEPAREQRGSRATVGSSVANPDPCWGGPPPTPVVRGVDDGSPASLLAADALRCLGNAVCPPQAAEALRRLLRRIA